MGVGVQGEARRVVAQHGGEGFDIYSVLQGQHRKCVSEVVESYPIQPRPFQHPLEHMEDAVRGHRAAVWRGEDVLIFLLHPLEDFDGFRSYRDAAVGVFCFQGCFHHLTVLTENLSSKSSCKQRVKKLGLRRLRSTDIAEPGICDADKQGQSSRDAALDEEDRRMINASDKPLRPEVTESQEIEDGASTAAFVRQSAEGAEADQQEQDTSTQFGILQIQ